MNVRVNIVARQNDEAALALAGLSPTRRDKQGGLLPPLKNIRAISQEVA